MNILRTIRIRMPHSGVGRSVALCPYPPRKRITGIILILFSVIFTFTMFSNSPSSFPKEDSLEERLVVMQSHIQFLGSICRAKEEDMMNAQRNVLYEREDTNGDVFISQTPQVMALLRNMTGSKTAEGIKDLRFIRSPMMYQLLPHLMEDPYSLRPAFHMKAKQHYSDIVIGIPTVKRDKEGYLMLTLSHLISEVKEAEVNKTLIIVFIGETDMEYVLRTAKEVEKIFPKYVARGIIEVMAPSASYYPDFDAMTPTLGDSAKRFKWRTKQNLDIMYLMTYARTRGTYYLMLEDDVIAKKDYLKEIKTFTAESIIKNPSWFLIEFCPQGGIGKLFRSADLLHFITYVQLFYQNMPIDWLLDSYLDDKICRIDKGSKHCIKQKLLIRPRYKSSLFLHIGLYSSLKGKIQAVKHKFVKTLQFHPHSNPPVVNIHSDIKSVENHSIQDAYAGKTFFWGVNPKKGDKIVFLFQRPVVLESYLFRSGNSEILKDKFYNTIVEVLPVTNNGTYVHVNTFDEFGLAEGQLGNDFGPLLAIRLRVLQEQTGSKYWVIISEIELKPKDVHNIRGLRNSM